MCFIEQQTTFLSSCVTCPRSSRQELEEIQLELISYGPPSPNNCPFQITTLLTNDRQC